MIQSVQERKKNMHNFMDSYPNLCRLQNTVPNPNIKLNNSNNFLDFVGDRLKLDDWKPLLEAISNDRSLHFISIRSKYNKSKGYKENEEDNQDRLSNTPKSSPLYTNDIMFKITESLSKCLSNSATLTGLLLEKLTLTPESLNHLTQGLEVCQNLQQLSLPFCQVGDDGCSTLCHVLRRRLNLIWLNLSGCGITERGVAILCDLLKFQKLNRYGESWKQSLRYRPVNPNTMPGLRRLTLNHNPIRDEGVKIFVDTLIDDLWLKALDLQDCEISLIGGENLLNLVKENHFLSVVDIRGNTKIPKSIVAAIVQQLAENNTDSNPEFQWLKEDNPRNNQTGSCKTSISKSSQRVVSNTTINSKCRSIISVLPNKSRVVPASAPIWNRTRSASAKRAQSSNNTPHPPWNSNVHSSLRRGNSAQFIVSNEKRNTEEILVELKSVKKQLEEVTRRLEEETERRLKIEQELQKYKEVTELRHNSVLTDKEVLQKVLLQLCNDYLTKNQTESPKPKMEEKEVKINMENMDNLDILIKTVNGKNIRNNNFELKTTDSLLSDSDSEIDLKDNNQITENETTRRARQLFESLLQSE